jgi:hypothetical protein
MRASELADALIRQHGGQEDLDRDCFLDLYLPALFGARLLSLGLLLLPLVEAVGGHAELADGCSLGRVRQLSILHEIGRAHV